MTLPFLLVPRTVLAEPVAIEVYAGRRPPASARWLAPVFDVLAERGVAVGAEGVGALIEQKLSRPGRVGRVDVKQVVEALDEGTALWRKGEFATAARTLEAALQTLRANPALVVGDASLRDSMFAGMLNWARSLSRAGNQYRAREVMADLARSYPDRPITVRDYGPAAEALYRDAVERLGMGWLNIRVDDPTVDIYVDGRFLGNGAIGQQVLAGRHRVYVQKGTRAGRVHDVEVRAGAPISLEVEWMFDACLYTSTSGGAGLRYVNRAERDRWKLRHILRLGELLSAPQVIAFGQDRVNGFPAFVGTSYDVEGRRMLRNGAIALATDPAVRDLQDLAGYLVGDPPRREVVLLEPIPAQYRPSESELFRSGWVKWATGATALGLGGLSAYLFSVDGQGTCGLPMRQCPEYIEVTAGKWSTGAAAVALATMTVWLFADDPWNRSRPVEFGLVFTGPMTGLSFGGSF